MISRIATKLSQLNISHLFALCITIVFKVKWFQLLLFSLNYCYISLAIQLNSHLFIELNDKTVQFQTIQFSISHLFAHSLNVKLFYLTLSVATTPGQSGSGNNGNKRGHHITQSAKSGASTSDGLMLYPGH